MICSKCSRELSAGQSWCEVCKGPAVFSSRELQSLQIDIRSRVLWGEPPEEIRDSWLMKGAPPAEIRRVYDEAMRERRRHFRMRGFQDLLTALGCLVLAAGALWLQQAISHKEIKVPSKLEPLIMAALLLLPGTAAFLLFRGVGRVVRGGAKEKSASDLSEFG